MILSIHFTRDGRRLITQHHSGMSPTETPYQVLTNHVPWPEHRIEPDVLNGARFTLISAALDALERHLNATEA